MTTQESYEKIRAFFSRPGAQLSKSDSDACYYRHPDDGRPCGVGCLIPDELYDPAMEQTPAALVIDDYLRDLIPDFETVGFLIDVQSTHDKRARDAKHFVTLLDALAENCGLTVVA